MAITRIGPEHQITIPQEIFEQLGPQPGDFLEVQVRDEALHLIPQKLVPRDQAWFWSQEWQEREREADEAIANGELSGPFESADDLVHHLRTNASP
jgi:antitoxin MazE